jgi:radical SAM protein with 4Fe4S-binding SPASM domain
MNEFGSASKVRMKRRWKKAWFRLRHLPKGINLIKYTVNKIYGFYLRAIKSTKVPHPSSIMIEVTNHCNLKCITCPREYALGNKMDKGAIDIIELKKIVDQVYPYVDSIGLTGLGETLLYKDLIEAVNYIHSKSKGIICSISINAHLPKSVAIVTELVDKLDTIQISIDGMHQIYNDIRLEGDYSFFIENVKKIAAAAKGKRADIMFNVVVLPQNYSQMPQIVQLAKEIGVRYVNFQTMNLASVDIYETSFYNFYSTPIFLEKLNEALKEGVATGVDVSTFEFDKKNEFQKCLLPWGHFYISWNGFMTPCCAKPFPKELNFGNVFTEGLQTTLNSTAYQAFRNQWHKNETPDFCKRCHMIDLPQIDIGQY